MPQRAAPPQLIPAARSRASCACTDYPLELAAGERLGIVGPNGAGKTTLLRLILGEIEGDSGTREIGATVRFAAMDQMRTALDPDALVIEELAGRSESVLVGERVVRAESYLDRFGLAIGQQRGLVRQLSGGERNRLLLAKLLCLGGNVLVLDEPTNDLDLSTLRALEEALLAFSGSVVVVSHDRWFLDRIATQILYLDGQGQARAHFGDMSALLADIASERAARRADEQARKPVVAHTPKPAQKKRITPWQQKELDELLAKIPLVESELAACDERLADPALYAGPKGKVMEVRGRREQLDLELKQLYARWEELEGLRSTPG